MRAIMSLFVQSPFAPLQRHMDQVSSCIEKMKESFEPFFSGEIEELKKLSREVTELEHAADQIKIDIRNHLPKGLFMPVDRGNILEILALQDSIADKAEDVGVLLTIKKLEVMEGFRELFDTFVIKNIEAFYAVKHIIENLNELLQSSFGGIEAEKVKQMVDEVAFKEHEGDQIQYKLLKVLYNSEGKISFQSFNMWLHIIQEIGSIADISEKLAYRVRMTLELK